jgi:acetoin utilization protein AcuB
MRAVEEKRRNKTMIVSMWMTRELVTIEPDTPITEAAALMAQRSIRRLPVVERRDGIHYPAGIITADDILHAYPPEVNPFAVTPTDSREAHVTVAHIMSRTLQTVTPETPIEDAARLMRNSKISTLLVVQKMKLVGLITESDIFRAFLSILEFTRGDVRITFEVVGEEDTFGMIAPIALRFGVRVVSLMSVHQDDRQLCVIRLAGAAVEKMLDELWQSGHRVLNVLRLP